MCVEWVRCGLDALDVVAAGIFCHFYRMPLPPCGEAFFECALGEVFSHERERDACAGVGQWAGRCEASRNVLAQRLDFLVAVFVVEEQLGHAAGAGGERGYGRRRRAH